MAGEESALSGTVVAIAGGARGIGLATAASMVRSGARVAIGDIDGELAAAAAAALGNDTLGLPLDVTRASSYSVFLDELERALGPLGVLVNSAGVMPLAPFVQQSEESVRHTLDVNLNGVLLGCRLAAARMLPRGRGELVLIGGIVGRPGFGGLGGGVAYAAAQQGLVGLSEALRGELRPGGVGVRMVLAGPADTEMAAGLRFGRLLRPAAAEDVAEAIVRALAQELDEVRVPAWLGRLELLARIGGRARRPLLRVLGLEGLLRDPDQRRRAAYEARIQPRASRDRAASVAHAAASVASALRAGEGEPPSPDRRAGGPASW